MAEPRQELLQRDQDAQHCLYGRHQAEHGDARRRIKGVIQTAGPECIEQCIPLEAYRSHEQEV